MTDSLDIQNQLRVYAASGIGISLSPEMCRNLADKIDLGEEAFQTGMEHLKKARRHLAVSFAALMASGAFFICAVFLL